MALEQGVCTSSLLLPFPYTYTGLASQYSSSSYPWCCAQSCLPPDPTLKQTQFSYQKNFDIRSGRHSLLGKMSLSTWKQSPWWSRRQYILTRHHTESKHHWFVHSWSQQGWSSKILVIPNSPPYLNVCLWGAQWVYRSNSSSLGSYTAPWDLITKEDHIKRVLFIP